MSSSLMYIARALCFTDVMFFSIYVQLRRILYYVLEAFQNLPAVVLRHVKSEVLNNDNNNNLMIRVTGTY